MEKLKQEGNQLFSAQDYEGALNIYLKAVELSGSNASGEDVKLVLLQNCAACQIKLGRYPEAEEFCNTALKIDPTAIKALFRRSQVWFHLSQHFLRQSGRRRGRKSGAFQMPSLISEKLFVCNSRNRIAYQLI
mmetsp:Transcript_8693/g.25334  ORF Transcript_8693/g.25334 Transcript_8693/m.25334 type:complete len:133 (-) Transcript_8693:332-730(-)